MNQSKRAWPRRANSRLIPALAIALLANGAWADGVIDILPDGVSTYTISSPGSYRLAGDLLVSDPSLTVIQITGDFVTLDLAGHVIQGTGEVGLPISGGVGIEILGYSARIHSGTVRTFDSHNILVSAEGTWLHDLHIEGAYIFGVNIANASARTLIERCFVLNNPGQGIQTFGTGESTIIRDSHFAGNGTGAQINTPNCQVIDCTFTDNTSRGAHFQSSTADAVITGCVFTGNGVGVHDQGTNNLIVNNLATGNSTNYLTVTPVTSVGAANDFADNLTP